MSAARRVAVDDRADEAWGDPARGTLHWRTLISGALTGTEGFVCGVAEIAPGEHFALHSHAEPEIYFGLEGEGEVMIEGETHRLAPGVALYIPGHAVHGIPLALTGMRWFYVFNTDSFEHIAYRFCHETEDTPAATVAAGAALQDTRSLTA
ncbi:cupin domain-containing protein [Aliigemmobacter aestuarii]|uniref:Cupin domain-containing protein n=1 Tax=Aliigemmobacter aestuarii TaxID=1445661 RepID=A0A4S3MM43_9RHOB|nr:cupin domain-containing protein [Gemmobacter aestuarii]THD83115.1 cupin domain-containing protein [Gemmobacter aestuarii]